MELNPCPLILKLWHSNGYSLSACFVRAQTLKPKLKLGDRVLAEISHQRQNLEVVMLLDPDGKKRHCNGRYKLKGGPSPEYKANTAAHPESLILEVCELQFEPDATQATKQTYEFRPVKAERR